MLAQSVWDLVVPHAVVRVWLGHKACLSTPKGKMVIGDVGPV